MKPFALLNFLQDIASKNAEDLGFGYSYIHPRNYAWFLIKYRMEFEEYPFDIQELNERIHSMDNTYIGIRRFIIGFCKKVFLANNIGFLWSEILSNYQSSSVLTMWLGIICFGLQIYFDFSGYSDMAIGLGKIMGFNFLENLLYFSKSINFFCLTNSIGKNIKKYPNNTPNVAIINQ